MQKVNAVTCASWVPKGVAKQDPDKVELSGEDLARIIDETKENLDDLEELDEEKYIALEVEALEEELLQQNKTKSKKKKKIDNNDQGKENESKDKEELEEIIKKYNFAAYDSEKDTLDTIHKLGKLTVHADSKSDPLITEKEDDDQSERDNHNILATDNLIAVGHLDGDAAILEVYVYNSTEDSFYVHHDILLPAIPLCTEWLSTGSEDTNMIAIGTMSPVIEIWDLDLVDSLEPAYKLGRRPKKKKKLKAGGEDGVDSKKSKKTKVLDAGYIHEDAVLCLAWNRELSHLLASGSVDETVILWDMHEGKGMQRKTEFKEKVQELQWHPTNTSCLLAGSCDKYVRLFDYNTDDGPKAWKLDGEVECITWDPTGQQPFHCLASTDQGSIYCIDTRKEGKTVWNIDAHDAACSGLALSPKCPGCLVSASEDEIVKIWDISSGKPELVVEQNPKLGVIHCVSACVDENFVFCFGGDNINNNFKVWDIRQFKKVRQKFCPRVGLPVDEDVDDNSEDEYSDVSEGHSEEDMDIDDAPGPSKKKKKKKKVKKFNSENTTVNVNVPSKKKRKKKGGHLDRRI